MAQRFLLEPPPWTLTPLTPTTITIAANATATIKYLITNQSKRPHNLVMTPIHGINQITTPGNCQNPIILGSLESCTLNLQVVGSALNANGITSGPVVCEKSNPLQCYKACEPNSLDITLVPAPANLVVNTETLVLSGLSPEVTLTGVARKLIITNDGDLPATGVTATDPGGWPTDTTVTGTTVTGNTCTGVTLASGESCEVTINPGSTTTDGCDVNDNNEPTPNIVPVISTNANSLNPGVVVLGYGCLFQGGRVFSIDDTTPDTESIGAKVLNDLATFIDWTADYDNDLEGPNPNSDGAGNTAAIVANTTSCTNGFCAALECSISSSGGYNDWYLPATCELGPGGNGITCTPTTNNIATNCSSCVSPGGYWSSTQDSSSRAWGDNPQFPGNFTEWKDDQSQVVCIREITT